MEKKIDRINPPSDKHKIDRDIIVESMRGPFPNPFSDDVNNEYRNYRYRDPASASETLTDFTTVRENENVVTLMLMDIIYHMHPGINHQLTYQILDFVKDGVVVGWNSEMNSSIELSDLQSGFYKRGREDSDGKIASIEIRIGADIWVRRDPDKSREMINTRHSQYKSDMIEGYGSERDEHGVVNFVNYQPRSVLGEGGKDLYPWSHLSEVPTDTIFTYRTESHTRTVFQQTGKTVPCLFCGQGDKDSVCVFVSMDRFDKVATDRTKMKPMKKHCALHPGNVLCSLVSRENTFQEGEHYGVRDRIQWALQ